jgi:hypothetical protein
MGEDPNEYAVANANTFVVANAAVVRALDLAGKRLLQGHQRHSWPGVASHDLHTRIRVGSRDRAEQALSGAWTHLNVLAEHLDPAMDTLALESTLQDYCVGLMEQSQPHRSEILAKVLSRRGFFRAQP